METSQELQHWGIKGQKWGIRRYQNPDGTLTEAGKKRYYYQNPDGSLTEAGKKDYMKAAKKGKLDLSKLSDNDLNMINSRFARENTYKQNIQKYEESKFSNQLKKAIIDRVRGNGGGNNSKGKSKSKGGIASLLAMPIKKAFEDAFKDDGKSSGGNDDKEKQNQKPKAEEDDEVLRGFKQGRHFVRYGYKESDELRESRIKNGKRFLEGSLPLSMGPNRTAEDVVRARKKPEVVRKNDEWWRNSMDSPDSWGWSSMRFDTSGYLMHDELYHWGIKGQKWGVRRFENPDGTLTPEGQQRYYGKRFEKESKKQERLNYKADQATQIRLTKDHASEAKKNLASGLAGAAAAAAGYGLIKAHGPKALSVERISGYDASTGKHFSYIQDAHKLILPTVGLLGVAIGGPTAVVGLGKAAYHGIRASVANSRASIAGHQKAAQKAKAHLEGMKEMFSNTPYAALVDERFG